MRCGGEMVGDAAVYTVVCVDFMVLHFFGISFCCLFLSVEPNRWDAI